MVYKKTVNYQQAVNLAIKAIDREIKRIAPQANMWDFYGLQSCKNYSDDRHKLEQAKEILNGQPKMEL